MFLSRSVTATRDIPPEVTQFRDEDNGVSEKPIQIARKNLRFLVEGNEPARILHSANR